MHRHIISQLKEWKISPVRKPLILEGARQVGKTWSVKDFASRCYDNLAYVNFEEHAYLRDLFKMDYDASRILTSLAAASGQKIIQGRTLIFLDEIQEASGGLTALKYLQENTPDQHIIAAGSLQGIELHKGVSFPVGKVQFMQLQPMTFLEFLRALGHDHLCEMIIKRDWESIEPFAPRYIDLLRQYYYVGGMPEAVQAWARHSDWDEVRRIQRDILTGYEMDFSKHAPSDIVPRLRQLWTSLPAQLSRENKKFVYGLVRQGARGREYESALRWLIDSGIVRKVDNVSAPRLPLRAYANTDSFKLYCLDVGLLGALCGLEPATLLQGHSVFTEFKGALTEQYVLQQLSQKYQPHYWAKSNSQQEIDFIIERGGTIVPVEVKAEANLRARSMASYIAEHHPPLAVRTSMTSHKKGNILTDMPLYAINAL